MDACCVDYERVLARARSADPDGIRRALAEDLPYEWLDAYKGMNPHQTNVLRVQDSGFEYLFDFPTELVEHEVLSAEVAVEDRLVAVHGESRPHSGKRNDSAMRRWPVGPVQFMATFHRGGYDRGHFIAHSLGGDLSINLFTQPSAVNRGWSEEGRLFRSMERYCQRHRGTYCFCRPIYVGRSAHPATIEFGLLKPDGELWVNTFSNTGSPGEMPEIERLLSEKVSGSPPPDRGRY